jgi:ABC-type glutathione transport system ATPase component
LAWYLDHVLPNEYGGRKSVLFCCKKSYWSEQIELDFPEDDDGENSVGNSAGPERAEGGGGHNVSKSTSFNTASSLSHKPIVEPTPPSMHSRARVRIKRLRKTFTEGRGSDKKTTTAVHGLDLTLYEDQITALLGHNGAGKSTSISMLTGLISPSGGDASIHGYSILNNMKEIRKSLGICPQINVLFGKLTCEEHLRLYGTLKGVSDDDLEEEVARKIEEVGLGEKAKIYSSALSGGMQRKLQCAMAFIGGSKVVFLSVQKIFVGLVHTSVVIWL